MTGPWLRAGRSGGGVANTIGFLTMHQLIWVSEEPSALTASSVLAWFSWHCIDSPYRVCLQLTHLRCASKHTSSLSLTSETCISQATLSAAIRNAASLPLSTSATTIRWTPAGRVLTLTLHTHTTVTLGRLHYCCMHLVARPSLVASRDMTAHASFRQAIYQCANSIVCPSMLAARAERDMSQSARGAVSVLKTVTKYALIVIIPPTNALLLFIIYIYIYIYILPTCFDPYGSSSGH
jgi:hypothetical protein